MKKNYLLTLCLLLAVLSRAQLTITPNNVATQLAQLIAGSGVTISNATLSCGANSSATFSYTGANLGLSNGVLLTTGDATTAAMPVNIQSGTSVGNNISDPDLTQIQSNADNNLCRLEFDFVPICPQVSFQYVFASEEYPEWVGQINDAFGVFLTGPNPAGGNYSAQNIALLPNGQPVSINNVNSSANDPSFVANYDLGYNDIVYDGFTIPITSTAAVTPCQSYHIKFAVADASDEDYDSAVFLQADGLSCTNTPTVSPTVAAATSCGANDGSASVSVSGATPLSYSWSPGGQTTAGITNQPPGTYTCVITFTNSCSTYTVAQILTIISSSITPTSNTPCEGSSLILNIDPGATYSWTGPGGYTSAVQSPTISPITPTNSGVYSVTVVTSSGCSATGSLNVSVNPMPTLTMPASQTVSCTSPSVSLVASASPANSVPSWTGGGICGGASSYSVDICSYGSYTLTVTNPATGCTNSGTVFIDASNDIPSGTTSNTGPITCITSTVEVALTTTYTPLSYSWSGPGTINGATSPTGTVTVPGVYACVITNTLTGCASTLVTNVTTNTTVPSVFITTPATITCAAPTVTLNATPSSGVTYTWSGPGIVSGTNTATPVINQAGNYSLTVTDSNNGCVGNGSITVITNADTPPLSLSSDSLYLTCTSTTATVLASSTVTPLSYTWSPAPFSGTNSDSPVFNTQGIYTVSVIDGGGCTNTATLSVETNTTVPLVTVPGTQTLTCATPTVTIIASSTPTTATAVWTGGVCAGATSFTADICSAGSYTLTVTDPFNGCTNSDIVTAVVNNDTPALTASGNGTLTCITPTAQVVVTTTSTAVSYSWTGTGTIMGSANATATVVAGGVFTCVVTNTISGCSATITANVPSDTTKPVASIATIPVNSFLSCTNHTVTLNATVNPSSNINYSWSTGSNGSSTSVTSAGVVSVTATNAINGCEVTTQYTVTSNTAAPTLTVADVVLTCDITSVPFAALSNTTVTYSWTEPVTGSIIAGANTASPTVVNVGTYTVTATNPVNGCSVTATAAVTQATVHAAFVADPTSGIAPLTVNFTNQSTGATSYIWIFGDGNGSTVTNPSNTYVNDGVYTTTLVAIAGSCIDSAAVTIIVEPFLYIEVPNVFTPNGDRANDVFFIRSKGVKELSLVIFNRWGQKVYEGSGANASWTGGDSEDGTYFYILHAEGNDGQTVDKQGTVNLFR